MEAASVAAEYHFYLRQHQLVVGELALAKWLESGLCIPDVKY